MRVGRVLDLEGIGLDSIGMSATVSSSVNGWASFGKLVCNIP